MSYTPPSRSCGGVVAHGNVDVVEDDRCERARHSRGRRHARASLTSRSQRWAQPDRVVAEDVTLEGEATPVGRLAALKIQRTSRPDPAAQAIEEPSSNLSASSSVRVPPRVRQELSDQRRLSESLLMRSPAARRPARRKLDAEAPAVRSGQAWPEPVGDRSARHRRHVAQVREATDARDQPQRTDARQRRPESPAGQAAAIAALEVSTGPAATCAARGRPKVLGAQAGESRYQLVIRRPQDFQSAGPTDPSSPRHDVEPAVAGELRGALTHPRVERARDGYPCQPLYARVPRAPFRPTHSAGKSSRTGAPVSRGHKVTPGGGASSNPTGRRV